MTATPTSRAGTATVPAPAGSLDLAAEARRRGQPLPTLDQLDVRP